MSPLEVAGPLTVVFFLASVRMCRKEFTDAPNTQVMIAGAETKRA